MKKILALLLALCLVLGCLAGCSSGGDDEGSSKKPTAAAADVEAGKYPATYCAEDGEEYDSSEYYLIIEDDGTGTLGFDGEEYAMDWEVSGSTFTFEDEDGSTFEGTVSGDVIEGILDGNIDFVFEKESGGKSSGKSMNTEQEAEEAPAANGDFDPVSAVIAGNEITVVGAELFKDIDDKDGIRIYWDFTNNSDETIYAGYDLSVLVEQEGFELNTTYCSYEDDVPEYGNNYLDIRPGVTIRCISEYSCKAEGDAVSFTIYEWGKEEDGLTVEFDPTDLPGRPAKDLEIEPIDAPAWTDAMPDEGDVGDAHVFIDTAEIVAGWESEKVIRVYFDYTNIGEEDNSLWWSTSIRAFQDGIELETDWAEEDVAEDDNFSTDIAPGESLRCAETWVIRSDSPIEIEVYDSWNEEYIGCVFEFTN